LYFKCLYIKAMKQAMSNTLKRIATLLTYLVLASLPFLGCAVSKSEPENAEAYYSTGVDYYLKQDHSKAIEYFEKAIELKPDYAEVYLNMGIAYEKLGNETKAAEYKSKAAELEQGQ